MARPTPDTEGVTDDAAQPQPCAAGRSAGFGGRWTVPCPTKARHSIGSPNAEPVWLFDQHFAEVSEAGLVKDQNIGEAEYQRREIERRVPSQPRRWLRAE